MGRIFLFKGEEELGSGWVHTWIRVAKGKYRYLERKIRGWSFDDWQIGRRQSSTYLTTLFCVYIFFFSVSTRQPSLVMMLLEGAEISGTWAMLRIPINYSVQVHLYLRAEILSSILRLPKSESDTGSERRSNLY